MKPVLDPTAHDPVDTPVVPVRHREVIAVRDQTCVFPWCTRPARSCDADHIVPVVAGRSDLSVQRGIALPRHHRFKTFTGWTYTTLDAGTYLWSCPHGYSYVRDLTGTERRHPTLITTAPHPAPNRRGHRHAPATIAGPRPARLGCR